MALPAFHHDDVRSARTDPTAFAALVETAYPVIYRYALGRTGNAADAEDVTQEAFAAAARGIRQLRDPSRFLGWLLGIARHRVHNLRRQRGRQRAALDRHSEQADLDRASAPPGQRLEAEEQARLVHDILETLPVKHADAIRLRHLEGLTYAEVAEVLGVPVKTVDTWLLRGMRTFRDRYARATSTNPGGTR